MRIAFLCGSLEAGRDGVGDYTRRLAGECVRQGHAVRIVALAERRLAHGGKACYESQCDSDVVIDCLRLDGGFSWANRISETAVWLEAFKPDWVSLQFVPYSYQRKGLPLRMAYDVRGISSEAAWSIMFHELSLGLNRGAGLKDRLVGMVQRAIIRRSSRVLSPRVVFTQCELYRQVLREWGIEANNLPLFGNIPVRTLEKNADVLPARFAERRSEYVVVGIFGNVESTDIVEEALAFISVVAHKQHKRLGVLHLGNASDLSNNRVQGAVRECRGAEFVALGPMEAAELSQVISAVDVGVVNTSEVRAEKSGTLAAFLDHDLPCVVSSRGWQPRGIPPVIAWEHRVVRVGDVEQLENELGKPRRPAERLPAVTRTFLQHLRQAHGGEPRLVNNERCVAI